MSEDWFVEKQIEIRINETIKASNPNPQYDYIGRNLSELLDIIISSGAKLFVSAVGIPPQWAIDKLHKAGVL